jgi:hypothetical protein
LIASGSRARRFPSNNSRDIADIVQILRKRKRDAVGTRCAPKLLSG